MAAQCEVFDSCNCKNSLPKFSMGTAAVFAVSI
jgi:hypothetical protein